MEQHALELLHLMAWILGAAGALMVALLSVIAAIARWNGGQILDRMDRQDGTMEEIKHLLSSETKLLREAQHAHDVRIVRLEAFKEQALNVLHFGRRHEDQDGGNN